MTYKVKFLPSALEEIRALAPEIRDQFKQQLVERAAAPHQTASQLHGFRNVFKIRLRIDGYRLVYSTNDVDSVILVIAVNNSKLT